tara:strand:- start:2726 stop:6169 length:3444 start_codon:yes stop_codon:yes gene_type:complete
MADTRSTVSIKVNIDADGAAAQIKVLEQRLKSLEKVSDRVGGRGRKSIAGQMDKATSAFSRLGKGMAGVTKGFGQLLGAMTKVNFIAMAAEMAVFTAGLLAIKLALLTGRAAAQVWSVAMKGVSVAAATVTAGLATAAAAMRQFQEAQMTPFLGGKSVGMGRARGISRGMGARNMGLLGGQGAQQVAAAQAKGGFKGVNSASFISALINAAGSADPAALAAVLSQTTVSGARNAMSGLAGVNKDALSGATTFEGLASALGGATKAGFGSTGETMANTFIGTVKTGFAGMKTMFADMGAPMLEPMREAFMQINQILTNNFLVLQSIIQKFGANSMAPTMVTIFDRMMKWITRNVIDHLDNIKEMGENFVGFFRSIKNFFQGMGAWLVQFEPAANVIIDMFKAASNANSSGLFRQFSKLLTDNAEGIKEFGAASGRLFGGVMNLFAGGNRGFFERIPMIVQTMDTITTKLIPAISDLWNRIAPVFDRLPEVIDSVAQAINAVAPFIGMLASAISQVIGILSKLGPLLGMMVFAGAGASGAKLFGIGTMARGLGRATGLNAANLGGKARAWWNAPARGQQALGKGMHGPVLTNAVKYGRYARMAGGLTTAVAGGAMAVQGGMEAWNTGRFSGKMAMGAGLGIMGAGMMGLTVTGPVGAAIIATALLTEGILAYFGNKKFKADSRKAMEEAFESRDKAREKKFTDGTFGVDDFNILTQEAKLLEAAIEAGFDDKGEWKGEGDTPEMRAYLRFLEEHGVEGATQKHRDESLQTAVDEGELEALQEDILKAEENRLAHITKFAEQTNLAFEKLGMSLEITAEEATELGQKLYGIDFFQSGGGVLGGLMLASHLGEIDRNQAFTPNFSGSMLSQNESMLSADAALNALAGDFNMNNLQDFTSKFAGYEISRGMSADMAGLSALVEVRQHAEAGVFGTNKNAALEAVNVAEQQMFADMGMSYNMDSIMLKAAFDTGGIEAVEAKITETQQVRRAIAGTDKSQDAFGRIQQIEQISGVNLRTDQDFLQNMGGRITDEQLDELGIQSHRAAYSDTGRQYNVTTSDEYRIEALMAKAEAGDEAANEALNEIMNQWMLDSDDMDGKRNQLLEGILEAAQNPVVIINGQEAGGAEVTISTVAESIRNTAQTVTSALTGLV